MIDGNILSRTSADIVKQVRVDNLKSENSGKGIWIMIGQPANLPIKNAAGDDFAASSYEQGHYSQHTHYNSRPGTPIPSVSSRD